MAKKLKMETVQRSVQVPIDDDYKLHQIARKQGVKYSELVRQALGEFVTKEKV